MPRAVSAENDAAGYPTGQSLDDRLQVIWKDSIELHNVSFCAPLESVASAVLILPEITAMVFFQYKSAKGEQKKSRSFKRDLQGIYHLILAIVDSVSDSNFYLLTQLLGRNTLSLLKISLSGYACCSPS